MSEIEKVHRVSELHVNGVFSQMFLPVWTVGSLGAVAIGFGLWPVSLALAVLVGYITYKRGLNVEVDDILETVYNNYFIGISDAGATPKVMPRDWILYPNLYSQERKEPVRNALKSVKPRTLSKAVLFGKELSLPVHSVPIGDLGGSMDYNIVIKGKKLSITSVRHTSDMEIWNRARTAAANLR